MLRLFTEQEANERAFTALTRFLDLVDDLPPRPGAQPGLDPLALSFQLKLLWVSGYLPHVSSCSECGSAVPLVGYLPQAGGGVCAGCAEGSRPVSPAGFAAIDGLLRRPLADAHEVPLGNGRAREALAVVSASYEYHGGFRLRTLSA
jgi:DNA repair protein RecO (recombination protein O)